MQTYEDDDDTHYCIKCHVTINGLENYVRHRQSGCRPPEAKQEAPLEHSTTPTTVTYPEILNADAFFSSLELQSSVKSNSTPRPRSTTTDRERKSGKSDDKKKKVRKEPDDGGGKEKLLTMPPVVTDLDDLMDNLAIPSLVGFPEIVTTPGNKSSAVGSGKSPGTASSSKVNNDDNLRDSPLESLMTNSKGSSERKRNTESQRIDQDHGEWLEDTILADLDANSENKEGDNVQLAGYAEYYRPDEESDDVSLEDEIGDAESYTDDDEPDDPDFSDPRLTGGKWKPSDLLQDISRLNDDEIDQDDNNRESPTVTHTGGKWEPADSSQLQRVEAEDEVAGSDPGASSLTPSGTSRQQALPGHTRGKWIPGAGGDLGSGYWCDPCGRKLASRLLYNRHLLSDLHARRSIQEIDGDLQLPSSVAPLRQGKSASKRQRALAEIKSRAKIRKTEETKETTQKKSRKREKTVLWCEMCRARVRRPQMGKHLLSHYHCRVAGANPCNSPTARRFILENMGNVVRQCPFQCTSCRFYCNTEETFLLHWRSKLHATKFEESGQNYKCTPCNFWCIENERMEQHLQSSGHREVVAMMNGSVPVVVRRQRSLVCETCNQHFRYNLQLRFHVRETGHRGSLTATDEYQVKIACNFCSEVLRSLVALQRHQLSCHSRTTDEKVKVVIQPAAPYFCSFCSLNFTTSKEAILHRRTLSHKEIVKAQKLTAENFDSLGRQCPHCSAKQGSLIDHKQHLLERHPELCHRCPRCGMLFALPQDVTMHTKSDGCTRTIAGSDDKGESDNKKWKCSTCIFVTDSQAEFLFHKALHAGSVDSNPDEPGSSKSPGKYQCPMCDKSFPKNSLRNHLRSHTGERPFRCVKCSASFSRRSGLNAHHKECVTSSTSSLSPTSEGRQRHYTCAECNTAFYTSRIVSRLVSYKETYTKRRLFVRRRLTRLNYKWETVREPILLYECCPGYTPETLQFTTLMRASATCSPMCQSGCTNGKCISPNTCDCNSGYRATASKNACIPHCTGDGPDGCGLYGSCTAPSKCVCYSGYTFTVTRTNGKTTSDVPCIPKCESGCGNNAFCQSPNTCACNIGYTRIKTEKSTPGYFNCEPSCVPKCGSNMNCFAPNKCQCDSGYLSTSLDVNVTGNSERPQSCSPVCDPPCVNGTCTRPGYCECHRGYMKTSTGWQYECSPICNPPCINASCTKPNYCECNTGYQKNTQNPQVCLPHCDPPCINGTCSKPGYCECHTGYQKKTENSQICSPHCDPPCINGTCTKPGYCECHTGYQKETENSQVCSPHCDPPCINGICTKPGHCECHTGYQKKTENSQVCSPHCDPPCINGTCTKPGHCECHTGYQKKTENSQVCSPHCDPPCSNGICTKPGYCECHTGYQKKPENSQVCSPHCDPSCINGTCTKPGHCECHTGYQKKTKNSQVCSPHCDPPCINGTCTKPGHCECHTGYQKKTENSQVCSPHCAPPCSNGICTKPGYCECINGYKKNLISSSQVCLPVCDPPCVNATCTGPNYCECYDGYEKELTSTESSNLQEIYENTCIPSCPEQCLNGTCIAPGQCLCDPGYVLRSTLLLSTTSTETAGDYDENSNSTSTFNQTSIQFCQPLCDPACPIGSECLSPNQCELEPDDSQDSKEFSINSTHIINSIEDCGRNVDFLDENNKCVCRYGWRGWRCEKPTLCGLVMRDSFEDNDEFTTPQSITAVSNDTMETTYDDSSDMRMISNDEDSGVLIDWEGPMCKEVCLIMTSSDISGNRSDDAVKCYLLESENVTTGVFSIRDQVLPPGSRNGTFICFISIDSECNVSNSEIVGGPVDSLMPIIIGIIILLLFVLVVGFIIYCRRKREISHNSNHSMGNTVMLVNAESIPLYDTEESSSI